MTINTDSENRIESGTGAVSERAPIQAKRIQWAVSVNDFSKRDLVAEISHQKVEEIGDCEVIEHTQLTSEGAFNKTNN